MKKIGPHYVPVLPSFSINPEATRQPREDEEQMSLEKYKLMTGWYFNIQVIQVITTLFQIAAIMPFSIEIAFIMCSMLITMY